MNDSSSGSFGATQYAFFLASTSRTIYNWRQCRMDARQNHSKLAAGLAFPETRCRSRRHVICYEVFHLRSQVESYQKVSESEMITMLAFSVFLWGCWEAPSSWCALKRQWCWRLGLIYSTQMISFLWSVFTTTTETLGRENGFHFCVPTRLGLLMTYLSKQLVI